MTLTKSQSKKADNIFERWNASLTNRDRSLNGIDDNFAELFYELHKLNIDFEFAKSYLEIAIIAHYPSRSLVKRYYKRRKDEFDSEKDFEKSWQQIIKHRATNVFYDWFQPPEEVEEKKDSTIPQGKGMSKDEYRRMRRYADSFPTLNPADFPDLDDFEVEDV